MSFQQILAYGFIPIGAVLLLFVLSGFRPLQRLSARILQAKISIAGIDLSFGFVSWLLVTVHLIVKGLTTGYIQKKLDTASEKMSVQFADALLGRKWQSDRDIWIDLATSLVWLSAMRASAVFRSFWIQIEQAKADRAAGKEVILPPAPWLEDEASAPTLEEINEAEVEKRRQEAETKENPLPPSAPTMEEIDEKHEETYPKQEKRRKIKQI